MRLPSPPLLPLPTPRAATETTALDDNGDDLLAIAALIELLWPESYYGKIDAEACLNFLDDQANFSFGKLDRDK
ncbi:hypothetical protein BGX20_011304 [Mortierella sp. AD010]|nr:hypothetical protein BGX20_011304 [Mortierella sp. AD010]